MSEKYPLPQGLNLKNSYCDLTPDSTKVNLLIENTTDKNIPAKAIVCQLNLANKIPKILLPTCNQSEDKNGVRSKIDNFSPGQADLDDSDIGQTFEKVGAHQVLVEDLGEDLDEDFREKHIMVNQTKSLLPISLQKKMSKDILQRVRIIRIVVNGC